MMSKQEPKASPAARAAAFNTAHPVGSAVTHNGTQTKVAKAAWVMGGIEVLCRVEGISRPIPIATLT